MPSVPLFLCAAKGGSVSTFSVSSLTNILLPQAFHFHVSQPHRAHSRATPFIKLTFNQVKFLKWRCLHEFPPATLGSLSEYERCSEAFHHTLSSFCMFSHFSLALLEALRGLDAVSYTVLWQLVTFWCDVPMLDSAPTNGHIGSWNVNTITKVVLY